MRRKIFNINMILGVCATVVFGLTGCGGGGGASGGVTTATDTVSGVAAAGSVISGSVFLKDSAVTPKELSKTIATDGSYSFEVTGMTKPYILKAVGTANGTSYTLYSLATDKGTANINPLSNLIVTNAAGSSDLVTIYSSPQLSTMLAMAIKLPQAASDVQTGISPLLQAYNISTVNPITDTYKADHTGLDDMFDRVKINTSNGTVTISNASTGSTILTSQVSDIQVGTVNSDNIPQPGASDTTTTGGSYITGSKGPIKKGDWVVDTATTVSNGVSETATYSYTVDSSDNLTNMTISTSSSISNYIYDSHGNATRVASNTNSSGNTTSILTDRSFTYNTNGTISSSKTFQNFSSANFKLDASVDSTYTYSSPGLIIDETATSGSTNSKRYYDSSYYLIKQVNTGFDGVTSTTTYINTYTYTNIIGNKLSNTKTYDNTGNLISNVDYSYTADGKQHVITSTYGTASMTQTFTYDSNRNISTLVTAGSSATPSTKTYTYKKL
ncbi:MAG: hypothetical protein WA140_02560 [Geobacteraceae bacterium]